MLKVMKEADLRAALAAPQEDGERDRQTPSRDSGWRPLRSRIGWRRAGQRTDDLRTNTPSNPNVGPARGASVDRIDCSPAVAVRTNGVACRSAWAWRVEGRVRRHHAFGRTST